MNSSVTPSNSWPDNLPLPTTVECWDEVDQANLDFQSAMPDVPVLLKGYVRHWPLVRRACSSAQAVAEYLMRFDSGSALEAMIADPREAGRLFYTDDFRNFNFIRMKGFLADALDILAAQSRQRRPAGFYIGSTPVSEYLPGLEEECHVPALGDSVAPNIWLGNSVLVATHNDNAHNLACVAAGRRRFTLFPPEQRNNLYIGDQPETPGGRPISLVDMRRPDVARFPRIGRALEVAQVADLEPGDALFLPRNWWHNVESFGALNILINFWWQ